MINLSAKPRLQSFHIEGVRHISPQEALKAVNNHEAMILDVREPNETALERMSLPDILFYPMSVITERLGFIPTDKLVITVCPGGVRSSKVAEILINNGFTNIASLDGGLNFWKAIKMPYEYFQPEEEVNRKTTPPDFKSLKDNLKVDMTKIGKKAE